VRYVLDTNVLLRIAQRNHPMHREARDCVRLLLRRKDELQIVPQVMFEFWVVATRPVANNGLGLAVDNVKRKLEKAESFFELLPDTAAIYHEWLRLVHAYAVLGVGAHDARIVAAMKTHAVTHLITFNADDFKRFNLTEITVVTLAEILRAVATSS
jgi:predicted nucleic acid-binding protein